MNHRHADQWADKLLQPEAVLGVIALAAQPLLLVLRAWELTHALILANTANQPIGVWTGFGLRYEIGTCAVAGAALTLAQMICASVFMMESPDSARRRLYRTLSSSVWLILSVFELASSVICANGGLWILVTAFVLPLVLTFGETLAGILIIDGLITPAALSLGWAIRQTLNR
jgi:hypothetical protein